MKDDPQEEEWIVTVSFERTLTGPMYVFVDGVVLSKEKPVLPRHTPFLKVTAGDELGAFMKAITILKDLGFEQGTGEENMKRRSKQK